MFKWLPLTTELVHGTYDRCPTSTAAWWHTLVVDAGVSLGAAAIVTECGSLITTD